jgi:hypothetical protein
LDDLACGGDFMLSNHELLEEELEVLGGYRCLRPESGRLLETGQQRQTRSVKAARRDG